MNIQTNIAARLADQLSRPKQLLELKLQVPDDLPVVPLVELFGGIETIPCDGHCPTLQLVGASAGCAGIAMDLAWAGASVMSKRILLINCASSAAGLAAMTGLEDRGGGEQQMAKVREQEIYILDVAGGPDMRSGYAADVILDCCESFSEIFDLIIVVPPPANRDPLASVMARRVDANILVVEAERTRRAEAVRVREMLVQSGRPLLGAILNNRRNYLPEWLSRRL